MNVRLADMNVGGGAADWAEVEILASGLPCFGGVQLVVDATMWCACSKDGLPRPRAHCEDVALFSDAISDKVERTWSLSEVAVASSSCSP